MQNRLVAENIIKTPLRGEPYISVNKKLFAYSLQKTLKINSFNKQGKQFDIKPENDSTIKQFELSMKNPWVYVITSKQTLEIYQIKEQNKQNVSKILTIKGVLLAKQANDCTVLDCIDNYYRILPFQLINSLIEDDKKQIQLEKLYSIHKKGPDTELLQFPENQNIFIKSTQNDGQNIITVFSMKKTNRYQKVLQIDYISNPISVYKDRYFFNLEESNTLTSYIEIYDINQSKVIGKITVQGQLKYSKIKQNMLTLILNVQNTDFYWFCLLNPKPDFNQTLITHRITYQKGKGDYFETINLKSSEALNFTEKKKQQVLNDLLPEQLDNTTSSVIYVLNKQKQKVEIIKLDHSKILESRFSQQKVSRKIVSNLIKIKLQDQKQNQSEQVDRARIKSSLQHKSDGNSLQQTQQKFVQTIVDNKIKIMMQKFDQIQLRIQRLQRTMKLIYQKLDQTMKIVNRDDVRTSVQSLFQQLTPQFEKYFSQLFKQVSGVLDQGVSFYNKKLASEAEIHKQSLNQIVSKTFEETQKIIQLSKKEEKLSERTEKHLIDLLDSRSKWQKKTEEFEEQSREVTVSNVRTVRQPSEGKVFVRADLNVSSKKQT